MPLDHLIRTMRSTTFENEACVVIDIDDAKAKEDDVNYDVDDSRDANVDNNISIAEKQ